MADNFSGGITIERIHIKKTDFTTTQQYEQATGSHRDEGNTFHIVEKGTVWIEIDFKKYTIIAPAVVYMHPSQVHRITGFNNVTVCSLAIGNENLNPVYLQVLEDMTPVPPLALGKDA